MAMRNICVREACGPSQPCEDGYACVFSAGTDINCCASSLIDGAYCETDVDECIPGLFCVADPGQTRFDKTCVYSQERGRWVCAPITNDCGCE